MPVLQMAQTAFNLLWACPGWALGLILQEWDGVNIIAYGIEQSKGVWYKGRQRFSSEYMQNFVTLY